MDEVARRWTVSVIADRDVERVLWSWRTWTTLSSGQAARSPVGQTLASRLTYCVLTDGGGGGFDSAAAAHRPNTAAAGLPDGGLAEAFQVVVTG
jgi:hypothetical protein